MSSENRADRDPGPQDDLLRQAKRLQRTLEATEKKRRREEKLSTGGRARRHAGDVYEFVAQVFAAFSWIYSRILQPLASNRLVGAPFRAYARLWRRSVYESDADGDVVFSKARAGTFVLATIVAALLAPAVLRTTAELIWDVSWMAASYRTDDVWYLGRSQEIDPDGNVFSAQGCESVSCTDQTSIYFRIKPSLAHHVWSLLKNRNLFFPDFVAAGIQNDVNKCHVTTYGSRWKLLVRNWDIYPQILSVECVPVTEAEIESVQPALTSPIGG